MLLMELQELNQSTTTILSQLQKENQHYIGYSTELEERLKKAQHDQVALTSSFEKEKVSSHLKKIYIIALFF